MKENQMRRSRSQALYKYVPERWIDFYISSKRQGFNVFVERWSSNISENINKKRLLRKVAAAVKSYQTQCALFINNREKIGIKNFADEINEKTYSVLEPRISESDRAISGSVSPRVFFCQKCHRVHRFKKGTQYSSIIGKHCFSPECNGRLVQLRDIYYCKCGWAGEVYIGDCDKHKGKPVKIDVKKHEYECTVCHRKQKIFRKCPDCGEKLIPHNVLDSAQSFVKTLNLIDLLDPKMDAFLSDEKDGALIITANYFGFLSDDEFVRAVKYGHSNQKKQKQSSYEKLYQDLISKGMPDEYAKIAAKTLCESNDSDPIEDSINRVKEYISNYQNINGFAEFVLEYNTIMNSETVVTLEGAANRAVELNTIVDEKKYLQEANKKGFINVQASDNIPFIQCAYGYTREFMDNASATNHNKPVVLKGFPNEIPGKKNVYATRLNTEGVLFEVDRVRILIWLEKNNIITESSLPSDLGDEAEVKAWFIDNVNTSLIEPFSTLSEEDPITYYVYRLVHTISHTLILAAAEVCGLDKNSLSEYIFPSIPAIFIYCQNTQGFNMGALFSIFEMYFDQWMENAMKIASECIFDPICIDHGAACAGCVFTNEISCQHFNHDLDRTMLIGKLDKETGHRFMGFWEEA